MNVARGLAQRPGRVSTGARTIKRNLATPKPFWPERQGSRFSPSWASQGELDMKTAAASTGVLDAREAGRQLTSQLQQGLGGSPQAIMLFAAPSYDHAALLDELASQFPDALLVGASSAGEFMNQTRGEGLACALGLAGDDVRFGVGLTRDITADAGAAAREIVAGFSGLSDFTFPYRSALVMADALAGHADVLVDELTLATGGQYQFFGGGAGDNAQFQRTSVFCGREVLNGAAVALEILTAEAHRGRRPPRLDAGVGRRSASPRPTGTRLVSLNGLPAAEAFEAHAATTAQTLDQGRADPVLPAQHPRHRGGRRPPAARAARHPPRRLGAVRRRSRPKGSVVYIMRASAASAVEAAPGSHPGRPGGPGRATSRKRRSSLTASRPGFAWATSSARRSTSCAASWPAPTCSAATPTARSRAPKASSRASTTARRSSPSCLRDLASDVPDLTQLISALAERQTRAETGRRPRREPSAPRTFWFCCATRS